MSDYFYFVNKLFLAAQVAVLELLDFFFFPHISSGKVGILCMYPCVEVYAIFYFIIISFLYI